MHLCEYLLLYRKQSLSRLLLSYRLMQHLTYLRLKPYGRVLIHVVLNSLYLILKLIYVLREHIDLSGYLLFPICELG